MCFRTIINYQAHKIIQHISNQVAVKIIFIRVVAQRAFECNIKRKHLKLGNI